MAAAGNYALCWRRANASIGSSTSGTAPANCLIRSATAWCAARLSDLRERRALIRTSLSEIEAQPAVGDVADLLDDSGEHQRARS